MTRGIRAEAAWIPSRAGAGVRERASHAHSHRDNCGLSTYRYSSLCGSANDQDHSTSSVLKEEPQTFWDHKRGMR